MRGIQSVTHGDWVMAQCFTDVIAARWETLEDYNIDFTTILGCGGLGCVFSTDDPEVVAKITTDPDEIQMFELLESYQPLPGFVEIHQIVFLARPDDAYHLILRQAATPLTQMFPESVGARDIIREAIDLIGWGNYIPINPIGV